MAARAAGLLVEGETMTKLKFSWRHLAAVGAVGWAAAHVLTAIGQTAPAPTGAPTTLAQTAPAPIGASTTLAQAVPSAAVQPSQPTHLTAETRAATPLAQPATVGQQVSPASGAAAPTKPVSTVSTTQRTLYQQPQSDPNEPPAPAPSPALNQYDTANRAYMAEPLAAPHAPEAIAPGEGCSLTGGNCAANCAAGGQCNSCRCMECCEPYFYTNGWYAGAEYLYLRPNFSSPVAAIDESAFVDPNTNASVLTDRCIVFDVDYDSTFRLFGGYRWGDCGEAIELSYWEVDTGEAFTSPPASASQFFAGFMGNIADAPGEILQSDFSVELNVWDIDYTKRVPLRKGSPSDGGHCCPLWDWAWSIGARIVDFDLNQNQSVFDAAGNATALGEVDSQFTGAGPRAGLEGRRYFGEGRKWSAYGTGHLALLLGDHELSATRTAGLTTDLQIEEFIRTVPVTELEVGVSRQIGCRTLLTAGYQFQAWWEIGQFESKKIVAEPGILSFDGLFVRLEHTFGGHRRSKCQSKCQ